MPPLLFYGIPLAVVVPLAVVLILGKWVRGGSIATASGGAALAFVVLWLKIQSATVAATNPQSPSVGEPAPYNDVLITFFTLVFAALLLLAAWAIALADAVRSRRWGWVALLCLALYATITAIVGLATTPILTCAYSSPQPSSCSIISPVTHTLIIVGCFVGPAISLVYALRLRAPQPRALPDGLSVSSLDAPQAEPL